MAPPIKLKKPIESSILTLKYNVLNDGIVAGDDKQANGIAILKGPLTRSDIDNSGADFEWLLSIGVIEEAGYFA